MRTAACAAFVYLFFGHFVLADIVSARMALGSPDAVICHSTDDDSSGGAPHSGIQHQNCVVCAFAGAAPPLPAAIVVAGVFSAAQPPVFHGQAALVPIARGHNPRTSQGPPQIV